MSNSISFIQPSLNLRDYVQNYYIAEFTGPPDTEEFEQKHLANGCVELFIGYDNTHSKCLNHLGEEFLTDSGIVGAHNLENSIRGLVMSPGNKTLKFVSVNFKQNGFYEIFKIPAIYLYNNFYNSNLVLGAGIKTIQEELGTAIDNTGRIKCIERFLFQTLLKNQNKGYNLKTGLNISAYINGRKGNVRLEDLKNEFKVSERTLQREFKSATGIPIKEFCKITRFFSLLEYITNKKKINWADMVSMFGYYDQAHMINEFRSATGISPSVYYKCINTNVFKLYNHLAILKPDLVYNDVSDALRKGTVSSINLSTVKS